MDLCTEARHLHQCRLSSHVSQRGVEPGRRDACFVMIGKRRIKNETAIDNRNTTFKARIKFGELRKTLIREASEKCPRKHQSLHSVIVSKCFRKRKENGALRD